MTFGWDREEYAQDALDRLASSLWYPFGTERRAAFTVSAAAFTYVALVLSTFPSMSVQMLRAGLGWFDETVVLLTQNTVATVGYVGLALIVVYAALTGIAVTNTIASVRVGGVSNAGDATGILPGLLASGCASCGAGVLGLMGFAGALAAMPFHGNLLRVGGIVLLLGVLVHTGDPTACRID